MTVQPVDQWLGVLARLINPASPGAAAEALEGLRDALVSEFPDPRTFSAMSAKCVASAERYGPVPDFGIICRSLRDYRQTFIPRASALSAPRIEPMPPPTQAEIDAVAAKLAAWRAEKADMPAPLAGSESRPFKPLFLSRSTLNALYAQRGLVGPSVPR